MRVRPCLDAALDEGPPAARRVEGRLPPSATAPVRGRLLRGLSDARPAQKAHLQSVQHGYVDVQRDQLKYNCDVLTRT